MTHWIVSQVSEDEAGEVVALANRAYRGEGGGWTNEAHLVEGPRTSNDAVREMMRSRGSFFAAREAGACPMVAAVFLERREDALYVGMLSVEPTMQDRGLGRTMMGWCEEYARRQGISRLTLTVLEGRDSLEAWYLRQGFVATGETVALLHGNGRMLRVLEKDLGQG